MGGTSVLIGLLPGPWTLAITNAVRLYVGFWGYPKGSSIGASGWYPEAPILYYNFSSSLPPWLPSRVGDGNVKRCNVTPGHLSDDHSNVVKRVRPTRKTRPSASSHVIPIQGIQRRGDGKDSPSSEGEGGEVGVPRNLFPRLGVG